MAIYKEFASGKDFERAGTGEYVVTLKEIKQVEMASFNDKSVMEPKFTWIFETGGKDVDSDGKPYQFRITTGIKYGADRAGLTKLIDSLFGRHLTEQEWEDLDLEKLQGVKFKQMVSLETNIETKKLYNQVQKTYRGKGSELKLEDYQYDKRQPVAADPVTATKDPFADS